MRPAGNVGSGKAQQSRRPAYCLLQGGSVHGDSERRQIANEPGAVQHEDNCSETRPANATFQLSEFILPGCMCRSSRTGMHRRRGPLAGVEGRQPAVAVEQGRPPRPERGAHRDIAALEGHSGGPSCQLLVGAFDLAPHLRPETLQFGRAKALERKYCTRLMIVVVQLYTLPITKSALSRIMTSGTNGCPLVCAVKG